MDAPGDVLHRIEQVCRGSASVTELVTRVATAPHAHVPMLPWPRLPGLIRSRYLTLVNRWDRLLGQPASSLLSATTSPADSLLWSEVQRELGVVDTATTAFGDRYGAWGFLELWRTTRPFTPEDLALLTALTPAVTEGLRSALARTFVDPDGAVAPVGPAVVVLGARRARARHPRRRAVSRIHLGGGRWLTVKASRLAADVAVSIEPATPAERTDLFGRCFGLSGRESEVLGLLAKGLDTRQIAAALVLSEHTVNDHAKAVLTKTHSRTRQALIARALGAG